MRNSCFSHNLIACLLISSTICTAHDTPYHLERCRSIVLDVKPGDIIKVELKIENNERIYEFDVRDDENRDWDLACRAGDPQIIEIEEEVFGITDKRFADYMKIGLDEARAIALRYYPGEIIEVEYELEESGVAVYEFDINTDAGKEMKIEIDAGSGALHEVARELWQIGYE